MRRVAVGSRGHLDHEALLGAHVNASTRQLHALKTPCSRSLSRIETERDEHKLRLPVSQIEVLSRSAMACILACPTRHNCAARKPYVEVQPLCVSRFNFVWASVVFQAVPHLLLSSHHGLQPLCVSLPHGRRHPESKS